MTSGERSESVNDEASDPSGEHPRHSHLPPGPDFEVITGNPSPAQLAALVTVLSKISGPTPGQDERNMWGHPVDKLRYPIFSWYRVTLLERTHLRR